MSSYGVGAKTEGGQAMHEACSNATTGLPPGVTLVCVIEITVAITL
jgi:hypothetical protein